MKSGAQRWLVSCYHGGMKEAFLLGEEDLSTLAEKVITILQNKRKEKGATKASIVLLDGDLGAGKTTFTKYLATFLGVEAESVHSPTFILKKEYPTKDNDFKNIIHIDAYRFTVPDEAKVLRLEEDLSSPENLILVEWPTKMTYLPADMEITFAVEDEHMRQITIEY